MRGTLQAIDPALTLTIDRGALSWGEVQPGVTDLTARLSVGDGVARLDTLQGAWGSGRLEASAVAPLDLLPALPVEVPRRGGPAEATLRLTGLDLATVPGAPEGLTGVVSVEADARAPRPDLESLDARVSVPELRAAFEGLTLTQAAPTAVRVAGGIATVEQFRLEGTVGTLTARGSAGLVGDRPLDLALNGDLNLAALDAVTQAARLEGSARLDVRAAGTVDAPDLSGTVALDDGRVAVDEPRIAAEHVNARIDLAGPRVTLATLTADVNGGTLDGSGAVTLGAGGIADVDLQFATKDFAFDAPLDLRSLSDAAIRVSRQGDEFVVGGQVTIKEAGLTGDVNFDTGLLATINRRKGLDLTEERNPLLERVRLNVDVDTATPILVDNNLAPRRDHRRPARARHALRPRDVRPAERAGGRRGDAERAALPGGARRHHASSASASILPSFDLQLTTTASNYDITLGVTGVPGETETTLTADPALPEPDIMALLVTGRTLDEMRGEEYDVAREQVLSYLTGRLGSTLGRGIQRATGLSEVRVEPNLIANEQDPTARLTVGQELTDRPEPRLLDRPRQQQRPDLGGRVRPDAAVPDAARCGRATTPTASTSATTCASAARRRRSASRASRPRVSAVEVAGDLALPESDIRDRLGLKAGDAYDYFAVRNGVDRIERDYMERGYLEARVRLSREVTEQTVGLRLEVTAGPRVDLPRRPVSTCRARSPTRSA